MQEKTISSLQNGLSRCSRSECRKLGASSSFFYCTSHPRETLKIFFFLMLKPVNSPWCLAEEGKTETILGKGGTSAGQYQGPAFSSCQVVCNEMRRNKPRNNVPLYRRMAGWVLAKSAGGPNVYTRMQILGRAYARFRRPISAINKSALSPPCIYASTCWCLFCIGGGGCERRSG